MGLAAPRKRMKLSHDPNNTKWTRNTGGFGHKIMTAQGWQPGDMLGAKDATHAEFHTAANTSHIRVLVKDDNLGLGAKQGSGLAEGECTGLDVFQSLLGRLNGKDEAVLMEEQKSRENLKRALYTERRWGSIRFVRGGLLVGDKIQEQLENEEERIRFVARGRPSMSANPASEIDASHSTQRENLGITQLKIKKEKRTKQKYRESMEVSSSTALTKSESISKSRDAGNKVSLLKCENSKKGRKKKKQLDDALEELAVLSSNSPAEERKNSNKTKDKHKKHEQKRKEKLEAATESEGEIRTFGQRPQVLLSQSISATPVSNSGSSTPLSILGSRHAVRSRNIAQKRLAVLDTTSLNQIFMMK